MLLAYYRKAKSNKSKHFNVLDHYGDAILESDCNHH